MVVEKASGKGSAFNPTVVVENNVPALEAALVQARAQAKEVRYVRAVENLERKIEKQEAQLTDAREGLVAAKAELEAYQAAQEGSN